MRATFYAQFEQRKRGNLREARLVRASQTMPHSIDGVLVKVSLEIPDGAFEPLEADGVIEAGFVGIPIEVESEDPLTPQQQEQARQWLEDRGARPIEDGEG